jgi:cell division protease FtsH
VSENYSNIQDNMTIKDFKNKICVSLAGRTAQIKLFGDIDGLDTGASNDLQQATRDAYAAIAHYGMDKEVGYININGVVDAKERSSSGKETKHYHEKIDAALEKWMIEGQKSTVDLVNQHWNTIQELSKLLFEKEIIYSDELDELLGLQ